MKLLTTSQLCSLLFILFITTVEIWWSKTCLSLLRPIQKVPGVVGRDLRENMKILKRGSLRGVPKVTRLLLLLLRSKNIELRKN